VTALLVVRLAVSVCFVAGRHDVGGSADRDGGRDVPRPDVTVLSYARQDRLESCQISTRGELTVPSVFYFSLASTFIAFPSLTSWHTPLGHSRVHN